MNWIICGYHLNLTWVIYDFFFRSRPDNIAMLRLLSFFLVTMVLEKLDLIDSINIEKCDTSHPVVCNCSNIGLSDLTENITHEADRNFLILHFSRNFIRTFPSGAFHVDNRLSSLLLDNNIISKIEPRAFKALTNLSTLYMSENNLDGRRISESQFDGLINLKTLKINHNPLRLVKKHTFSYIDVPRLARLELSHCQIRELEDGSISQLVYLEHLDLGCNELETFHRNHLFGLTSLRTLNISHNFLVILNELPHFESLRDMYIDNNNISQMSIRDDMLLRTPLLECLSLRHNEIRL